MRKTNELVLGAMSAGLVAILAFVNYVTFGYFQMFIPIPLMFYGSRASFRSTIVTYVVSIFVVFLTMGIEYATLTLGYGLIAIFYKVAKERFKKPIFKYIGAGIANCINFSILLTFFKTLLDMDVQKEIESMAMMLNLPAPSITPLIGAIFVGIVAVLEASVVVFFYDTLEPLLHKIEK